MTRIPTGKRKIVNLFSAHPNELDMPEFQRIVKRVNNCKASYWNCKNCTIRQLSKCLTRARQHIEYKAFMKYKDTPEYRKALLKKGIHL
jgi:tryptophanyl-tRNA synthetase